MHLLQGKKRLLLSCGECHSPVHQGVRTASSVQWKQTHFLSERTESSCAQAQGLLEKADLPLPSASRHSNLMYLLTHRITCIEDSKANPPLSTLSTGNGKKSMAFEAYASDYYPNSCCQFLLQSHNLNLLHFYTFVLRVREMFEMRKL